MSGDCPVGVTLTDPTMCGVLKEARTEPLERPTVTPPTPVADELMPAAMKKAISECTGTSSCKFIGYDFDSGEATKVSSSQYVVDTYSTTIENSGVLVPKVKKTSGTLSGVTAVPATGESTGTVRYTADNGQTYTFQGRWNSIKTDNESVDVYYDPTDMALGVLRPEDLAPPVLVEPPGYELPDFQAASTSDSNLINRPVVSSVEECAAQCDSEAQCTGFNFGGIDISSVCELVKDTTTRAYADGMSGFRKETISTTQTGDGSNPSETDLTNQGLYCKDAPACNTDIARIITENVGSPNPIVSLSTSDIASCAYCPLRTYATAGNVTTNEIGVSKSNPTPAAAVAELQYSMDGTSATHVTLVHGGLYNVKFYIPIDTIYDRADAGSTGFKIAYDDLKVIAISNGNGGWQFIGRRGTVYIAGIGQVRRGSWSRQYIITYYGQQEKWCTMSPVDYVTNGFILTNENGEIFQGPHGGFDKIEVWSSISHPKFSRGYNRTILVFTPIDFSTLMVDAAIEPTNPYIYRNARGDFYKIDINTGRARKFDPIALQWYTELNPSWAIWVNTPQVIDIDVFWDTVITGYDADMPDPYEALNQFRTFDIAPPSTAQAWAYDRRQGCNNNCGNVQNGYAIYKCRGTDGGNCDPGQGAYVTGPVCSGTHISCRPADDSTDLKEQFSFKFAGLLPASTKVVGGGSATTHDTDSLRIRTIYSLGSSVSSNPAESIQKLSTIFPPFVFARIRQIPGLQGILPSLVCNPGLYVNGTSPYAYCDICPGNPQPTATQVWRPDPNNLGSTLCAFNECPIGQIPDALHILCRNNLCLPGNTVTAANVCEQCPRVQYPWWAESSATTGPGYYWPDSPIPNNIIWAPNTNIPGTYLCEFSRCQQSGTWAVNNNTRCGGTCPRGSELDTDGTCRQCPPLPADVRVDQTWDYDMINFPDGSGQIETYKCTLRQCPAGSYTYNYNERYCTACPTYVKKVSIFNAVGFHAQYGYTPPTRAVDTMFNLTPDWDLAQKEAYCTFSGCKTGYETLAGYEHLPCETCSANYTWNGNACVACPYGSMAERDWASGGARTCTSCPSIAGIIATYSSGCTVTGCEVIPGGRVVSTALSPTSGRCEVTACITGYTGGACENCATDYTWNGTACVACPAGNYTIASGPTSGPRSCVCKTGYTGASCDQCATDYVWNGSTACVACPAGRVAQAGPAAGAARTCSCPTDRKGTSCEYCADNYVWTFTGIGFGKACYPCQNGGTKQNSLADTSGATDSCDCPAGFLSQGTCDSCAKDHIWTGSACVACKNGGTTSVALPANATTLGWTCTCPTGYTGTYCENCAQDYTWNNTSKTCVACKFGGTIQSGTASGSTRNCNCPTGYTYSACQNCAANYVWDGYACVACVHGTSTTQSASGTTARTCTCDIGYKGALCVNACDTGYGGSNCTQCLANYRWNGATCVACLFNGTKLAGTASGAVQSCTCQTGYTGASCENCDTNYTWNGSACVACPAGNYTIASGPTSGPRSCACKTGYSGATCQNCALDYAWNGSACVTCPLNSFTAGNTPIAAGAAVLQACVCRTGYIGSTAGALGYFYLGTACDLCDTNYTWNGSTCVSCLNNSSAAKGTASGLARSCTCNTGYTGASCDQCATNYTWDGSTCQPCLFNSTAASGPASGSVRNCNCQPGYTGPRCEYCATNYAWNGTNACVACGTNRAIASSGAWGSARTCPCKTGYTGTSCENCALNYTWNGLACVACSSTSSAPVGTASGLSRSCTCITGYTGTQCDQCAANHLFINNCTPCLNGGTKMNAPAVWVSGASCQCPTGYSGPTCEFCATNYRWDGSGCVACQNGGNISSVAAVIGQTVGSCNCPTGYTGASCEFCAQDYKWNGSTACVPCPANSTNSPGSASGVESYCTCSYYYRWNGSACVSCPSGAVGNMTATGASKLCYCRTNYSWTGSACVACTGYTTISAGWATGLARSCSYF